MGAVGNRKAHVRAEILVKDQKNIPSSVDIAGDGLSTVHRGSLPWLTVHIAREIAKTLVKWA